MSSIEGRAVDAESSRDDEAGWSSDDLVLVIPGLPPNLSHTEGDRYVYPSSTLAFVKMMRSEGIPIELAVPRQGAAFVSHNAADIWLPIVQVALAMLAGAGGNLISSMIEKAFKREAGPVRVHIDWRVKEKKGTVHRFKFVGSQKEAVKAAKIFEASLRGAVDEKD
jgi:hypothetical protein